MNFSKNLKVRALVFDITVLIGGQPLKSAPSVAQFQEKKLSPIYDQSSEIQNISTVQTKYMDKIRNRLGNSDGNPLIGRTASRPTGDGEILKQSKSLPQTVDNSPSRWLLSQGMGNILDYTVQRTISLGLISSDNKSAQHLQQQLVSSVKFNHVIDSSNGLGNEFDRMDTIFSIPSNQVFVVSGDEKILEIAKSRGYFTCRYRFPNSLYGQTATTFVASNPLEIQDAMEELNGVAFRNSAFQFRTFT